MGSSVPSLQVRKLVPAWGLSFERHAEVPFGACAGLSRTPRPSASNSIPAFSSAALTQAQLAAQAGISTTAMNNIEHGTDAKGSTLRAIHKLIFFRGESTKTGHRAPGADLVNRDHIAVPQS
jgi:hypothetical protein